MKNNLKQGLLFKFIASFLLTIICFQYLLPTYIYAATSNIEGTYSYAEWKDLKNNEEYKDLIEKYGVDKYEKLLEEEAIKAICEIIYADEYSIVDMTDATQEEYKQIAKNLLETEPNGVKIKAELKISKGLFSVSCDFSIIGIGLTEKADEVSTETTKKYDELLIWTGKTEDELDQEIIELIHNEFFKETGEILGDADTEDVARKILELNKNTIILTVIGTKDKYVINSFEVPGKDEYTLDVEAGEALGIPTSKDRQEEDSADLGGILLSPFVALFNFIADAIIGGLDNIMNGNGLITGDGVLRTTKPENKNSTENAVEINVDVKSFLPTNIISGLIGAVGDLISGDDESSFKYKYPNFGYTPEEIFKGEIELLSIDFITGTNYKGEENKDSGWVNIRKVVSQWYNVLRMIAIIGLLSALIYIGIKIILSANARDKAKYKEWIVDWFLAAVILFAMHFIMAFIIAITSEFSDLMTSAFQGVHVIPSDNPEHAFYTNLMGFVRFMVQSQNFYIKIAYEVMYIALIVYTIKFTVMYLKRVLNMAFLTLIAPIVALTYPIDKINDGKAQGFNMWLKEYIFNALLQPMHCILYFVLVGSAAEIAVKNPLYGVVVLMFMTEAEKLLKKIFGFDKAGATSTTTGNMTGAFAAGAFASKMISTAKLLNGGKGRKWW